MKILNKLLILSLVVFTAMSCEDNEKYPLPVPNEGAFITFDVDNGLIDVTDIDNSAFSGTLTDPRANIASHTFEVRSVFSGTASDYVQVYQATTFPVDFAITAADIAAVLGVEVSSFQPGTKFEFTGTSITTAGVEVTYNNISADLQAETGQKQAYLLSTFISCPFNRADALGTYTISDPSGFALNGATTFEVIAGEEANEIIMVNPFGGNEAYDITIMVDPSSGIATVEDQAAFSTDEQCCPGFEATTVETQDGNGGFVFSCAGVITLNLDTSIVQIGTGSRFTFGSLVYGGTKI